MGGDQKVHIQLQNADWELAEGRTHPFHTYHENLGRLYFVGVYSLEKEMATHSRTLAWRSLVGYSPWGH